MAEKKHLMHNQKRHCVDADGIVQHLINECYSPFTGLDTLFDLILYVPVNNFSVMSGQVFLG